jgi:hypothetical protein
MSPNSPNSQGIQNLPEFRTGPLITGAALVGAGTMVALVPEAQWAKGPRWTGQR